MNMDRAGGVSKLAEATRPYLTSHLPKKVCGEGSPSFILVESGGTYCSPKVEPTHELNFRVPESDDDKVVAACYMQLEPKIENSGRFS